MPNDRSLNGLSGKLQSSEAWARQQSLALIREILAQAMASLTPAQQRTYVRLQRAAHAALDAVEKQNNKLIKRFKIRGVAQLRARLDGQDPEQIFLLTRYLEKLEPPLPWEPRPSGLGLKRLQKRFRRAYDEWKYRSHLSTLSLWEAACLNFDFATGVPQQSGHSFVHASYLSGAKNLTVTQFVAISRDLDLGGQLHTLLQKELGKNGKLESLLATSARACLQFEALEAYRNRANTGVTLALYEQFTKSIDGSGPALDFETLGMSTGVTLLPAVPFVPSGSTTPIPLLLIKVGSLGVLSYFPFRPGGALRYHDDAKSAAEHFLEQLKTSHREHDLGWFARQLPMPEMHDFKRLSRHEQRPTGLSPVAGWLYDTFHRWFPEQSLDSLRFTPDPKHGRAENLVQALTYRHVQRYQANLATLATRRSERDQQALVDGVAAIADEVLQLLLTPMPGGVTGLNRVMQVAVFGSLTYSVVIGINEAAKGEASQFASALADVMDMAVNGQLTSTAGRVHRQRIEGLLRRLGSPRKVTGTNGDAVIWKPDISAYAILDQNLLNGQTANAQGVYAVNGKQYVWLRQGENQWVMEVTFDEKSMRFVLKQANGAHYAPPIVFDPPSQAWVLDLNNAHTLSDIELTERMLPNGSPAVPQADMAHMLLSTAPSRETLDRIWAGAPTPLNLTEGVRRLQADQLLTQLSRDFHRRGHMPPHGDRIVLCLLTQLPGWPVNTQIQVHDAQSRYIETYAATPHQANGGHVLSVKRRDDGTYVSLDAADTTVPPQEHLFELILRQLPGDSTLGREGSPNFTEAQRIARLRLLISQKAQAERLAVFSALTRYADHSRLDVPITDEARHFVPLKVGEPSVEVTPLLKKMTALFSPLTPIQLDQLLKQTPLDDSQQLRFLSDASLPDRVREHLDHHRTAMRIDQVIDGLYHPRAFNPDTDLWAREFASSLLASRVARKFVVTDISSGPAIDRFVPSGPEDTTVELLYYGNGRYRAYDHRSGEIPVSPDHDSFYLAIGSVLHPHERLKMGMNSPVDAQGLRKTLGDVMSAQRSPEGYVTLLDRSLGQYQLGTVLPTELRPNAQGVYEQDGQQLLALAGSVYAITFDNRRLKWRLQHPEKIGVDTPLLEHNHHGAWRLAVENPMGWDDHRLFSRLGPGDYNVDQVTASRILKITDTPPRALREVHSANLPPPPLLADTSKRFRIERDILLFIEAMTTFPINRNARPSLQLLLVTALAGWPNSHALEIVDADGKVLRQYPSSRRADAEYIRITEEQSRGAEPLENIALNNTVTRAILGELPSTQEERLFKLAKKVAEHAYRERAQLFETLYAQSEQSGTPLERRFKAHHPDLPGSAVRAILEHATPRECKQLQDHNQVGLRLAEQARLTANDVRLNRAYEGLYLNALGNPDSEKITLHLLKSVPGWPADLRVDIRGGDTKGELLESAGHPNGERRRVLARRDDGYLAYDSAGRVLNDPADAGQDLLSALSLLFSPLECTALGIVDGLDVTPLQYAIADLALGQRVAIKTLLDLPHIPPWLQPPMRVDSSFTAYPFNMRALWPFTMRQPVDLFSKVQELYPSYTRGQADDLIRSLGNEAAALIELDRRKAEYQTLDYGLTRWAEARYAIDALDLAGLNLGRRRYLAQQIRKAWRQETRQTYIDGVFDVHCLVLQMDGNELPNADFILGTRGFEHIKYLRIGSDAFPLTGNAFLSKFANLTYLKLDCGLSALPTSVTNMAHLENLDLTDNNIVLTPQARSRLNAMTTLQGLYLDANPLGMTPNVTGMNNLRVLTLRNTGIEHWPAGAETLFNLEHLLLQENRITTLPEAVYTDVRLGPLNQHTVLHDNPLNEATLTRIRDYRTRTGIILGGALPGIDHVPPGAADVSPWLASVASSHHEARKQLWEQLKQHEETSPDDAFRVLRDLTHSYAYTHNNTTRQALTDRVWRLLDAMGKSTELRNNVFLNTYVAGTCGDGALLTFIDMEIEHKVHRAKNQPGSRQADRELLALAKSLFYLRHVDRLAENHIERLRQSRIDPDDAEVKLYYRLKLRRDFDLPIQREEMLYSVEEWVAAADITQARNTLMEIGLTQAQQTALEMEDFWIAYLARNYPEPFHTIDDMAQQQTQALNQEIPDKRSDEYLSRRQSIIDLEEAERARLVTQLTKAAQIAQKAN
ncbi:hypothetical protein DYL61_25080 [Pseudomonas nabeulensis]|uniref:RING-type E3 ubiquitin transferase n=1 Tax=Pseudomonas nabeulensis TaxID=2293833 RepID=A0A4Z0ANQ7_9PSED|nr:NEL-type E3 ubiquitin ligase domain-containing protein [Pseudomonas nabeulensis]TFY88043.1 hypothetical protein DYL61_25080 [Pseudomonas nabeulensis]